MFESRSSLVFIGVLLLGFFPMAPVAQAGGGTAAIAWTFYNNGSDTPCASFSGEPALSYNGYGEPIEAPEGCNADNWTGRGTGYFESPVSRLVEFCATADDFIDVTINNNLILDNKGQDGGCTDFLLLQGLCYELILDFVEVGGYANFFLAWDAYGSSEPMTRLDLIEGPCPEREGGSFGFSFEIPELNSSEAELRELPSTR